MLSYHMWSWVFGSAVLGFVVLTCGALAVRLCRRPIERSRLTLWVLLAAIAVPALANSAILPRLRFEVLPAAIAEFGPVDGKQVSLPAEQRAAVSTGAEGQAFEPVAQLDPEKLASAPEQLDDNSQSRSAVMLTTPAAANVAGSTPLATWQIVILSVYVLIVCALAARLGLGIFARSRLLRTSTPVAERVRQVFRSVSGPAGDRVRLVMSERVSGPAMWGLWRPVIVLPAIWIEQKSTAELRYGLAHEWSHVEQRDMAVRYLEVAAEFVCFYQPAFWWLRRELALSQDQLADARAAGEAAAPEDYAQFLVGLVRQQTMRLVPGTLGISGGRNQLFRRVALLLQSGEPPLRHCSPAWHLSVAAIAVLATLAIATVRLDPAPAAETEQPPTAAPASAPAAASQETDGSLTYEGRVTDHISGNPIAGADVEIKLSLSRDPKTNAERDLREIQTRTDGDGRYRFTLTADEAAESSLYIVFNAHHANYASMGEGGYAHSMILKNLSLGSKPFFDNIKLWPGQAVSGTVVSPAGMPVAGVEITTYSKHDELLTKGRLLFGGWGKTQTDQEGRFQIVLATPGDGVLWLKPAAHAPQAIRLKDRRGDLDRIVLSEGHSIAGKVLSAQGAPVVGEKIEVRRTGDGDEVDEFLGQNAVANGIRREAQTAGDGRFEVAPLPPGEYVVKVKTGAPNDSFKVPTHVFVPQRVTLSDEPVPPLEIRAVPHVFIRATVVNSKGEPRTGHAAHIFGRVGQEFFFAQSNDPGKDGKLEVKIPHGLERVELSLVTNEHSALRWRLKPADPPQNGGRIRLGTVEEDVTGIEIIRYTAPILLIKAVDEAGQPVPGFKPKATYAKDSPKDPNSFFINGVQGDVHFEEQEDGRWRSSQLLPDQKLIASATKDGSEAESHELTLAEGETKEVVVVLKTKAAAGDTASVNEVP